MTDAPAAVLFDIDGTLVDSNYLHVEAWVHALSDAGASVDAWRIHRLIGKDSKLLLREMLGDGADHVKERAKELNARYFEDMIPRLRRFDGARELVVELALRGVTVVLATSAPANELAVLRTVLDVDEHVAEYTSSEDVETAKPEPDILRVALEKGGADAERSFMIGDSVWDMVASVKAGVRAIGVRSGGVSSAELTDAGAIAVYDDVAELLERLDESALSELW